MQLLDRYVARIYLTSWLVSLTFFVGFFGILDFFGDVGEIIESRERLGTTLTEVVQFYVYSLPRIYLQVVPFVMLMAALLTVTRLQRHNEFMAMVLTGRRSARVLLPLFVCTALFIGVMAVVQEAVAPDVSVRADELRSRVIAKDRRYVIGEVNLRDASNRQINARGFDVRSGVVDRLLVAYTDEYGRHVRVEGSQAVYDEEAVGWRLSRGTMTLAERSQELNPVEQPVAFFRTDVRPEDLLVDERDPFDLSYRQVIELSERYPLSRFYRLLRHYHITYPLSIMLLVMLGVPFVIRRGARNPMVGVGYSMALCLAFMVLDTTCRDLGVRGVIQWPAIAAWLPVIIAGSFVVVFFDSVDL